ncbi:amine oxidase [Setomelanomma holmii]|uniref:Amine oxidase n=1 Tax=Setomelanomma holmii TaxID=210430 RepID=A0A9P4HMJ1_9PLEO|nr:amine oxidase [Setomelanomma holmii]
MEKKRVAIVGSGVSGLSALWTLRNTGYEIHLFEKEDRLGGHTNTVTWTHNGKNTPVDTGFIVLNTATYPNFIKFLEAIDVKIVASEMTFGISRDAGAFEWSGTSGSALFAQPENALKPSFWRMIFDIIRFNQFALDLLSITPGSSSTSITAETSIGQYLEQEGYSDAFRDDYLIPMTACVWSTGADKCALEFPAITLVRFMWNHHLLTTISERPPWLTIAGGAKNYIDAVMKECNHAQVHLNTPIISLRPSNGQVQLVLGGKAQGQTETFDDVILACHGDQARRIVSHSAPPSDLAILSAFETTPNTAYLHSDLNLMPKRRTAWSAWNYLTTSSPPSSATSTSPSGDLQTVSLTYNMNILQHIPVADFSDVLVTLNPETPPAKELTQATYEYAHPLYNARMIAAQDELETIQGRRGIWYAGAWTGYGFHEDGFSSGMRVGLKLGGDVPWEVKDAKFSRGIRPTLWWKDYVVRFVVLVVQIWIRALEGVLRVRGGTGLKRGGVVNVNGIGAAIDGKKTKAL